MRLLSSEHAPLIVLGLAATPDLALSELAVAIGTTPSATQRALSILVDDNVVERITTQGPRYRLLGSRRAEAVLALSQQVVPLELAAVVTSRASNAIELVSLRASEMVIVLSSSATSARIAPAARAVEQLCSTHGLTARFLEHDDIRRELRASDTLRETMRSAQVIFGDAERSFPEYRQRALSKGRPLGHPHPELKRVSQNLVRRLARKHSLSSLRLFGSAVRTDFTPDSDVDVLIDYRPGHRVTLESLTDIERTLEAVLERDVDLVRHDMLRPELEASVSAEAVSLL